MEQKRTSINELPSYKSKLDYQSIIKPDPKRKSFLLINESLIWKRQFEVSDRRTITSPERKNSKSLFFQSKEYKKCRNTDSHSISPVNKTIMVINNDTKEIYEKNSNDGEDKRIKVML